MRGTKAATVDEDYEVGAEAEESRPSGSEKPLSSRYRGVCWNRKNRRWQAAINSGGKYVYLGSFLSEYDAARAFDKAAVKLRGTRAKLNFPYSEYVDENGNLLEDPKMKNVMCKIEAIQGVVGHGTGAATAVSGGLLKSDPSCEDNCRLMSAEAAPLPLPLPATQAHDDVTFGQPAGGPPPPPPPPRPMSPLLHSGNGGGGNGGHSGGVQLKQQHVCSSDGSKLPEWHGTRGVSLQPALNLQLNLAANPPGPPQQQHPPHQQQHQQQHQQLPRAQLQGAVEPLLFPQFPETVTTGGLGVPRGGAGGTSCLTRGPEGNVSGLVGTPHMSVASSVAAAAPGRMLQPPSRSRSGPQPPSPLHPLYGGLQHSGAGGPPGVCMSGNGSCYEVPPSSTLMQSGHASGTASVVAPPLRYPSLLVQRTLLRELSLNGPVVSFLRFVTNQFKENPEDTVGVLYIDPRAPGRVGSAVWNGKCVIRMGLYDTERDACQASIRCMQLNCMFGIDQPRADMFNAMTDFTGPDVMDYGANQDHYDTVPPPPPPPPSGPHLPSLPYSSRGTPRGNGNGGTMLLVDAPLDPHSHAQHHASNHNAHHHHHHHHHHHQGGGSYGQRSSSGGAALSYHGPDSNNAAAMQQQQQAPPSPAGGSGAHGFGAPFDHHVDEPGGATLQLAKGAKQPNLIPLFEAMAQYRSLSNMKSGSDSDRVSDHLQDGNGTGAGVLGKRSLHGDYASLSELAHCQKRHVEPKRMRMDAISGTGGQLELRLEPPSREFHDAHKMPLPMVLKPWQQQQQAAAGVL